MGKASMAPDGDGELELLAAVIKRAVKDSFGIKNPWIAAEAREFLEAFAPDVAERCRKAQVHAKSQSRSHDRCEEAIRQGGGGP